MKKMNALENLTAREVCKILSANLHKLIKIYNWKNELVFNGIINECILQEGIIPCVRCYVSTKYKPNTIWFSEYAIVGWGIKVMPEIDLMLFKIEHDIA